MVSEYLGGREASVPPDFLSGLLEDRPGEGLNPFSRMAPAGFSVTGSDSGFVLVNERSVSFPGLARGGLQGPFPRGLLPGNTPFRRLISRDYGLLGAADNSPAGCGSCNSMGDIWLS